MPPNRSPRYRRYRPLLLLLLLLPLLGWIGVRQVPPLPLAALELSTEVLDQRGVPLRLYTTETGMWRLPVDSRQVDPRFIAELLAYEDKRFHHHPGVDPLALIRAIGQWIHHRRPISGASTITMQTIRLLHPRPRTLRNKLIEMVQALQLEQALRHTPSPLARSETKEKSTQNPKETKDTNVFLTDFRNFRDFRNSREQPPHETPTPRTRQEVKRLILDLYLTLAPYGGNLQGLEAATRFYLGKSPNHLTPSERALLIALPQSPTQRRPDRHPEQAHTARSHVLQRLQQAGLLQAEERALAEQQPLPKQRRPAPLHAPHLADRLRRAHPNQQHLHTTLDGQLQRALERLAAAQQHHLEEGVTLAALVMRQQDGAILAYLGSGDFLKTSQLDLVTAVRSPGSALKPFIYGLGFEQGILHPETRLHDRPRWIGEYGPRNFDAGYRGVVTVREALQHSLNTPAVQVLAAVGPLHLQHRLAQQGVTLHLPQQASAGLPIALGGVGITLEQLTLLYAAQANAGITPQPRYLLASETLSRGRLLTPQASWYLDEILSGSEPPAGHLRRDPLRFKTGTSYGYRDAWAVGYTGDYTIGVWVGRPDGGYTTTLTGISAAAPLLFRIADLLPNTPHRRARPEGVVRLTHSQLPPMLQWFGSPPNRTSGGPPQIRFPVDGAQLLLDRESNVTLMVEGGVPPYHWLVDGRPVATRQLRRESLWFPDGPGAAQISVIDAAGNTNRVAVWVGRF